jgi:hypothetical protein
MLWEDKLTAKIKCPKCGRLGILNIKTVQSYKGGYSKGLYPRVIHRDPRTECYISRRAIATGGILPHLLRKKRRALEFRLKHDLPSKSRRKIEIRRRSEANDQQQLQQPQIRTRSTRKIPAFTPVVKFDAKVETAKSQLQPPTAPTPLGGYERLVQPAQPPINLAGFAFTRDGNYVTVQHPPDLPVVVLLTRRGELYCGGCLKTDCVHVQATKRWLKTNST